MVAGAEELIMSASDIIKKLTGEQKETISGKYEEIMNTTLGLKKKTIKYIRKSMDINLLVPA